MDLETCSRRPASAAPPGLRRALRHFQAWCHRATAPCNGPCGGAPGPVPMTADPLLCWARFVTAGHDDDDDEGPQTVAARAVRRHPHLLHALCAAAGRELTAAERRWARRLRLTAVRRPTAEPRVRCTRATGSRLGPCPRAEGPPPPDGGGGGGDLLSTALRRWAPDPGPRGWCQYVVQALGVFLADPRWVGGDRARLAALDGPAVRAACLALAAERAWPDPTLHAVRACVLRCKAHPDLDPELRFQSHLHRVPRAWMDAHPSLWRYPAGVAHRLRALADAADAAHLLQFLDECADRRLLRLPPQRDPQRARDALARRFLWILRLLEAGHAPGTPWRTGVLPCGLDRPGLVRLLARAVVALRRAHAHRDPARAATAAGVLVCFFATRIRDGVFEPRIPCHAWRLDPVSLERAVREEEAARRGAPAQAPAGGPTASAHDTAAAGSRRRDRGDLTDADVLALGAACRTDRERAFLALVSTTGLRSCAVGMARVTDAWDARRGEVRPRISVVEKNSEVRTFVPCPRLREALHRYLSGPERPDAARGPFLFPGPRWPGRPCLSVARNLLRPLCRRAGLPPFSPHQFRHYVVNALMERGSRLECVSRWLGHRSPGVTFRHYWTSTETGIRWDGPESEARGGPPSGAAAASAASREDEAQRLYEALRAKVEECEALRLELALGGGLASGDPPREEAKGAATTE